MIALFLMACGGAEQAPPAPEPAPAPEAPAAVSDVAKALGVAKAIDADPSKADEALKAAGLTEDAYRELLYTISQDAKQAAAFAAGR